MTTLGDIAAAIEEWAPPASAQDYDNPGLQVGDPGREITHAIVALDLTPEVVKEAVRDSVQLVVTHHPPIFVPIRHLTTRDFVGSMLLQLAEHRIGVYSAHTNLDAARDGVSFELARQLGLTEVAFLEPMVSACVKLVTFVPTVAADTVRRALGDAGGGRIGLYDHCAFVAEGTGYFRPGTGTNPMVGEADGPLESVSELRLEVEVERWRLPDVVRALGASHPYDEVAYDVYQLQQPSTQTGMGAVGDLGTAEPLEVFLDRVSRSLDSKCIRYAGDPETMIRRVAVCGGSGSGLIRAARSSGADAFVTADVSYHRFFESLDADGRPTMTIIDAGHYETESSAEGLLVRYLEDRFPATRWSRTTYRTSPIQSYAR